MQSTILFDSQSDYIYDILGDLFQQDTKSNTGYMKVKDIKQQKQIVKQIKNQFTDKKITNNNKLIEFLLIIFLIKDFKFDLPSKTYLKQLLLVSQKFNLEQLIKPQSLKIAQKELLQLQQYLEKQIKKLEKS